MLLSTPWYGSTTLAWTAATPIVTAIVGIPAFWATYYPPKGRLLRSIVSVEALLSVHHKTPEVKVIYRGESYDDPYRATIRIASRGRKDIEFLRDQPMVLDVGAKVIDILDSSYSDGSPPLDVLSDGAKIKMGPGPSYIIRKGETIKITFLADGPVQGLKWELPFTEVIDGVLNDQDPKWLLRFGLVLFLTLVSTMFLYSTTWKPAVTTRPLFLFFILMELACYIPAVVTVKLRQRQDAMD
jgi:hypothetical protein